MRAVSSVSVAYLSRSVEYSHPQRARDLAWPVRSIDTKLKEQMRHFEGAWDTSCSLLPTTLIHLVKPNFQLSLRPLVRVHFDSSFQFAINFPGQVVRCSDGRFQRSAVDERGRCCVRARWSKSPRIRSLRAQQLTSTPVKNIFYVLDCFHLRFEVPRRWAQHIKTRTSTPRRHVSPAINIPPSCIHPHWRPSQT